KLAAELLAARGLWRLPAEKRLAQDVGYYVFKRSPGSRDFPIAIISLAEQMLGDSIDNHVPGSGVEGKYLFRRCAGRNRSEIRDARAACVHRLQHSAANALGVGKFCVCEKFEFCTCVARAPPPA